MAAQSDENAPMPRAGSATAIPAIPDHELIRRIAQGSYGEVWLARTTLGAYRAVKIVRRSQFLDPKPFEREFEGIQNFEPVSREHEGLVDILQVGSDQQEGLFYYIMELADDASSPGGTIEPGQYVPRTLALDLNTRGALPMDEVIRMGVSLAKGLGYLHSRGLIHRDIKPSNIIFVGGVPKLADAGLVAELGSTISLVGTLGYMPAEGPGTVAADIYSLGKVLYEAATGKDRQQFPELPTSLSSESADHLLIELNEVVLRACAPNPERRYQSASALLADLELLRAGQSIRAVRGRKRLARKAAAAAGVLALLALIAGVAWFVNRPQLIFDGDFSGDRLDTNQWVQAETNWINPAYPGMHRSELRVGRGELRLEVGTEHTNGYSATTGLWVDSRQDFREFGECRIEVDVVGTRCNGWFNFSISEGGPLVDLDDSLAVLLARLPRRDDAPRSNVPVDLEANIAVVLLPDYQTAIVFPNANDSETYEVMDLAKLRKWHLRFQVMSVSSFGITNSSAVFRVRKVKSYTEEFRRRVIGYVEVHPGVRPLEGASVLDEQGMVVARTLQNGAFLYEPSKWPVTISVAHPEFHSSQTINISGNPRERSPVTIRLKKRVIGFGDTESAIPMEFASGITFGFLGDKLLGIYPGPEHKTTLLRSFDLGAAIVEPGGIELQLGNPILTGLAQCGERLLGIRVHPGEIYELDLSSQTHRFLTKPTTPDGRHIDWPWDSAFDGQFLWLLEQDEPAGHAWMHALDVNSLRVVHSLRVGGRDYGLAWDGDNRCFWICGDDGLVYSLDRERALKGTDARRERGREFRGLYRNLEYRNGYLWGADFQHKQICKINVR